MGYSKNLENLRSFYTHVKALEQGEPYMWYLEADAKPGDIDRLAYRIRECLYLAKLYPTAYPGLTAAADRYIIEVVDGFKVQARLTSTIIPEAVILTEGTRVDPVHGGDTSHAGQALATEGPQTEFTIIEVWTKAAKAGNANTPLYFPQAALGYGSLVNLWRWCQARRPKLMILVDGDAVTVGPVDDHVVAYSWRPEPQDLPPDVEVPKVVPVPPKKY